MTTFGNWPLLERLTNDEFLKLLPYLELEQYSLTQAFVPNKKWIYLLEPNLHTLQLKCGVCNRQVRYEDTRNHIIQNDHLGYLRSKVKQFYHPFYTYGKVDMFLARGEHAPQEVREVALREVNLQMKSFKKQCMFGKQFSNIVQQKLRGKDKEQLIETILGKEIKSPDDMITIFTLPLEHAPKLKFCSVSDEWRTAFECKNVSKQPLLHCNICMVSCSGIESLNSHLKGYIHRFKQLDLLALCYIYNSKVNKNCCIQFGNSFSFSFKEDTNNLHSDSWIKTLPIEIAKKVKRLCEYIPKINTYSDNICDQKYTARREKLENIGHLGVEYVLKIVKNKNDLDPRFECGLCEFIGDEKKMQRHLLSYEHKKKYLDLHYSDTIKKYESSIGHMCYREFRAVMSKITFQVSLEIEKQHSRSLPYTVSVGDYNTRRPDLIAKAYALLHASQNRGPSFSNVLSKDDIIILKNSTKALPENMPCENYEYIVFTKAPSDKVYLNQMSHDPVVRLREYNARMSKVIQCRTSCSRSPVQSKDYDRTRRDDSYSKRPDIYAPDKRARSRSPINGRKNTFLQPQVLQSLFNHNIWDIYRREEAKSENEIKMTYENYRKNPESHPLYEKEWNNFWQLRKKELDRDGYNHRFHNFQPEWVHYFKQRIEVLFGEALHKSLIKIRQKLELPLNAEADSQRSYESNHQVTDRPIKCNVIDEEISRYKENKRASSSEFKVCTPENKKIFGDQMHRQQLNNLNESKSEYITSKIMDNHSDVIHVLRLITALEEHLGSLGKKVLDLLSNALQLEKSFSGNNIEFETKILTFDNCQLLETTMEKLKGILFAGLLDEKKIYGFNRVIQHTENLLKYVENRAWRQKDNLSDRKVLHNSDTERGIEDQSYFMRDKHFVPPEKALSDTLIDLLNTPQINRKQMENCNVEFESHTKEHSILPDCPPPPNIRESSTNMFADFRTHQYYSGLVLFDTKLSFGEGNQFRKQGDYSELRHLNNNQIISGSNLYNNSFKSNNHTRTNINTRTIIGANMRSAMDINSETSPQFRNSEIIPNITLTNAMYQGGGGKNHNQNWLQRNRIN